MAEEIQYLIDKLSQKRSAIVRPPADEDDLNDIMGEMLEEVGILPPKEYTDFLLLSDGVSWNGTTFYGVDSYIAGYTEICNLLEINQRYDYHEKLEGSVVLGHKDDELYIYNYESGRFSIFDIFSGDNMEEFATFKELFKKTLSL